jgi:hypothetical protein
LGEVRFVGGLFDYIFDLRVDRDWQLPLQLHTSKILLIPRLEQAEKLGFRDPIKPGSQHLISNWQEKVRAD